MIMFTYSGAINYAQSQVNKRRCFFWKPLTLTATADRPHVWIHDHAGTLTYYAQPSRHADHLIIEKEGAARLIPVGAAAAQIGQVQA